MAPTTDIDFNELWKREQVARRPPDNAEYWNQRAPSFQRTAGTSPYARTFLDWAGAREGETVFDMGCGSGTLALPLAKAGHEVWAADFSQTMLDLMMQRAELEGYAQRIHPVCLAWEDDWAQADIPLCDLAFASRSTATSDLKNALLKLDTKARRRVCVTLGTNESPRHDNVITQVLGRQLPKRPDFVYAMNILWDCGIDAELRFISSVRDDTFDSFEEGVEKFTAIYKATPEEQERLEAYAREHLVRTETAEGVKWVYDHKRVTKWAFVSWDK